MGVPNRGTVGVTIVGAGAGANEIGAATEGASMAGAQATVPQYWPQPALNDTTGRQLVAGAQAAVSGA